MVRRAALVLVMLLAPGCSDLREFRGTWRGERVGDAEVLRLGIAPGRVTATLAIDSIDGHGLAARLAIDGFLPETVIKSLPGAEADVLAGMTFSGAPLRVYLAFAPMADAGGEALAVVALYDDRRVEVRLLRGGTKPLYDIFAMAETP